METAIVTPVPSPPLLSTARRQHAFFWGWCRAVWPAGLVSLLLLVLVGVTVHGIKAQENGRFVYTLDDGYFHMAVAKNLLHHGLWGTSALDGFSSGTSSLLWPLIIAGTFACFGIHEYFPLVLNLLAAIGLLFYAGWVVRRTTGSSFLSLLILAAIVMFMPVMAVASTGMEHCLQALLDLIFVDLAARLLTADAQRLHSKSAACWLCVVVVLLVMTRYESLFLVAPVGLLLLCQRRWVLAASLGVAAATPIVLFGLVAVSKGWYFLPNSLLLKGNISVALTAGGLFDYFTLWYAATQTDRHMFTLLVAVAVVLTGSLQRRRTLWNYPSLFLFITLLTMLQHLQFAKIGWFYRYEAYLIVLALVGIGIAFGYEPSAGNWRAWFSVRALPQIAALALVTVLLATPLWVRGMDSIPHVRGASYNIYEQQYQMGLFVRKYYNHKAVAANDVGAISFLGDISVLDLVGLSDIQVLRARRAGHFNSDVVRRLSKERHVELVMIYDSWSGIYGGPLPEWVLVGQWRILHNMIVGSDTVSFYAPSAEFVPRITHQMRDFSASLPKDIIQSGSYRETHPLQALGTYGPEGESAAVFWTGEWAPRFSGLENGLSSAFIPKKASP